MRINIILKLPQLTYKAQTMLWINWNGHRKDVYMCLNEGEFLRYINKKKKMNKTNLATIHI